MPRIFKILPTLAVCCLIGPAAFAVDPTPLIPGQWQLEFQDDFDGTSLDGTKWRLGTHWAGMAGTAGTVPENVTVADGKLRLKMEERTVTSGGATRSYATGEVSSFFNFNQQHGAFEARVKCPAVKGLWPAFWLMPDREQYGYRDLYSRSYVKFDLTGVNPGTINTAELKMKVSAVETGVENNVVIMRLNNDTWSESGITWNNAPVPDPVWIAQKWNQSAGTDMTVNVKNFVTGEMTGDKKISFVLADTFMRTKAVKFHSSEATTQANRPRLVINGVTYYAIEDAHVQWGTKANTSYPSTTELTVKDDWGNTATTWNGGMEIDIMEFLGIWGPDTNAHAMHWDGYDSDHQSTGSGEFSYPPTPDEFHVYGLYWEAGRLKFYVDGYKTYEWENSRVMSVPAYLLLSLQAGGWGGNDAGPQVHNQTMEVDWVRVWSGTTIATPVVRVTGHERPVNQGSTTPTGTNLTHFGYGNVAGAPVTRTYTILNTGDAPLTLDPPVISGANAADFTISSPPASSVASGGSTDFSVTFHPAAVGPCSATVSFGTDDSIRNPFTFAIGGIGKISTLPATAGNGTWANTAGGTWSTTGNWAGATVAGGAGFTADFNGLNLTAPATVSLDSEVALGSLVFGDTTATADPSSGANFLNGNTITPTGGWALNDGGNFLNTLTLDVATGSPVITVNDLGSYYVAYGVTRKAATINTVIEGTDGLTKSGAGRLALTGANTFSGGLTVAAGTVTMSGAQGFTGGVSASGPTSRLEFTDDSNFGINEILLTGGATLYRLGQTAGTVGTGRTLTLGTGGGAVGYGSSGSVLTMNHSLEGAGLLTVNAPGQGINLNGSNASHTGGIHISNGALLFTTAASLPPVGQILIGASGSLVGSGANTPQGWLDSDRIDPVSAGALLLNTGSVNSQDVDFTGYGSLFLGGSNRINLGSPNTVTYSGTLTPHGSTYRVTGGRGVALAFANINAFTGSRSVIAGISTVGSTVRVTAPNNYTGTTTVNGSTTLVAAASGALGSGAVTVSSGGALHIAGGVSQNNALTLNGNPSDTTVGALHGLGGANFWNGDISLATGSRIVALNTTGNSLTISGNIGLGANALSFLSGTGGTFLGGDITVSGNISGTAGITKTNTTGTLTLLAANAGWSGNMTLQGGTLALGNNAALGTTGTLVLTNSATVRSTDATARTIGKAFGTFAGTTPTYAFGATAGGTGNLTFSNTANASIGTAARTFAIHNTTRFHGGFTSTGSIIKTGGGTMIMNGTSTYSGGTTVSAGTLGGTGTIGATTVLAGATLSPGDAGIGTLHTGAVTFSGGTFAVEINGSAADKLTSTGAVNLGGATLTVSELGNFTGPYVIAEGTSITGTMTVPAGYAVNISGGTQAILTQAMLTQTGAPANFAGWASANGVAGGANGDADNDGISNAVEYALNLNLAGSDGTPGTYSGNVLTFNKRPAASGNSDVSYRIEVSADLGTSAAWTEVAAYLQNDASIISASVPSGPGNTFARLRVVIAP